MKLNEFDKSIFENPEGVYFVQTISADLTCDSGLALIFNDKFDIKRKLQEKNPNGIVSFNGWRNDCVFEYPVFNLVIKEHSYDRPTLQHLEIALRELRSLMYKYNIEHIAMPPIGCEIKQLDWNKVKELIRKTFKATKFTIDIYYGDSSLYERPVLELYPAHMELSPYEAGDNFVLERQYSKWDDVRHKYIPFAYVVDHGRLYLPRGSSLEFIQGQYPNVTIVNRMNKTTNKRCFQPVGMKFPPRDTLQMDIISFLMHQGRYANPHTLQYSLTSQTDSGKTYCACNMIATRGIRTLIIVHQVKIKEQWLDTLKTKTELDASQIVDLDDDLQIQGFIDWELEADVFVMTHQKIDSYVKKYGWESFNRFLNNAGIGIKIYDEAHLFFEHILEIDFFTNVMETYYLTATFSRSNPREARMFQEAFSFAQKWKIASGDERRKHVIYCPIVFNTHPYLEDINRVLTRYGFSGSNYIKYALETDSFKTILEVLNDVFSKVQDQEGKSLIVSPTISSANEIMEYMQKNFPEKRTDVIHSKITKEKDEVAENSDVISSTIKSSGTGVNIKGLRFLFCLEPHSSMNVTIQLAGRLREYDSEKNTFMFDFFDIGFPQMVTMYENHLKAMKPRALEIRPMKF